MKQSQAGSNPASAQVGNFKEKMKKPKRRKIKWRVREVKCPICGGSGRVEGTACYGCLGNGTMPLIEKRPLMEKLSTPNQ